MTVFKKNVYMTAAKWCDQGMSKNTRVSRFGAGRI